MILFAGHTLELTKEVEEKKTDKKEKDDKESKTEEKKEFYLVPMEGNKDEANSLISLSWLFDKLSKCRAKQKLLILDVCRYPHTRGLMAGPDRRNERAARRPC